MFKSNGNNIFQNKKRGIPVFLVKLRAKPTTITWGSDVVLRGHFPGRRSWRGSSRFYRLSPGNRVRSTASPIYMGESWWTLGYHRTRQFPPTSRHPLKLKKRALHIFGKWISKLMAGLPCWECLGDGGNKLLKPGKNGGVARSRFAWSWSVSSMDVSSWNDNMIWYGLIWWYRVVLPCVHRKPVALFHSYCR